MVELVSHTVELGVKMLVLSLVSSALSWYFIMNPSFPSLLGLLVAVASVFGFAHIILSSVDEMIQREYRDTSY